MKQECYGYRDTSTLRIHDHTQEVSSKAKARRKPVNTAQSSSVIPLIPQPTPSDEQDIFSYSVGTIEGHGFLSMLPGILVTPPSSALQATIKAVGLASVSRFQRLPGITQSAGENYGAALLATNAALRDPVLAKADSTLAAVVLLSLYEVSSILKTLTADNFAKQNTR